MVSGTPRLGRVLSLAAVREYERRGPRGQEEHVRGYTDTRQALLRHLQEVHGKQDHHLYGHTGTAESLDAYHKMVHDTQRVLGPRLLHEYELPPKVHARTLLGPGYQKEPSAAMFRGEQVALAREPSVLMRAMLDPDFGGHGKGHGVGGPLMQAMMGPAPTTPGAKALGRVRDYVRRGRRGQPEQVHGYAESPRDRSRPSFSLDPKYGPVRVKAHLDTTKGRYSLTKHLMEGHGIRVGADIPDDRLVAMHAEADHSALERGERH